MGGVIDDIGKGFAQFGRDIDPFYSKSAVRQWGREVDFTSSTFKPSTLAKTIFPVLALPGASQGTDWAAEELGLQKSDKQKADEAAQAALDAKRAAIAKRPDLTDMVVKANRDLKALQGRSILSISAGLVKK